MTDMTMCVANKLYFWNVRESYDERTKKNMAKGIEVLRRRKRRKRRRRGKRRKGRERGGEREGEGRGKGLMFFSTYVNGNGMKLKGLEISNQIRKSDLRFNWMQRKGTNWHNTIQYNSVHYTTQLCTTLQCTTLYHTTLHNTTLHNTTQQTFHFTTISYNTQHTTHTIHFPTNKFNLNGSIS